MAESFVGREIPLTFDGELSMDSGERWVVRMESGDLKGRVFELEVMESVYNVRLDKTTVHSKIVKEVFDA